jgi:hypothetical protein
LAKKINQNFNLEFCGKLRKYLRKQNKTAQEKEIASSQ